MASCSSAFATATVQPQALLLDAQQLSAKELSALQSRSRWWIGFEHIIADNAKKNARKVQFNRPSMMLIGFDQALDQSISVPAKARLETFANRTRQDFALQSAANCKHQHDVPVLPAFAEVGRANLVLLPKDFSHPFSAELLSLPDGGQWLSRRSRTERRKVVEPFVQSVVQEISPTRWLADLTQLTTWKRNSYAPEVDLARDWISQQFTGMRLSVQTPTFSIPSPTGTQMENVIATQLGTTLPDEWIIVGAHYDSTNTSTTNTSNPSPGAEDNASGCAGVLEMARILSRHNFKRSIKYLCFGGEEQGLHGSTAYVSGLVASNELSKIKLAVTMDMIGYSSDTRFDVLLETSSALQAVFTPFQQAAADYSSNLTVLTSTNPFGSDHMPFIDRSVPSLLLIEDEYDTYTHYHRTTDTPANVTNAQQQGPAILRMAIAVVAQQAERELLRDGFE